MGRCDSVLGGPFLGIGVQHSNSAFSKTSHRTVGQPLRCNRCGLTGRQATRLRVNPDFFMRLQERQPRFPAKVPKSGMPAPTTDRPNQTCPPPRRSFPLRDCDSRRPETAALPAPGSENGPIFDGDPNRQCWPGDRPRLHARCHSFTASYQARRNGNQRQRHIIEPFAADPATQNIRVIAIHAEQVRIEGKLGPRSNSDQQALLAVVGRLFCR